MRNVLVLTLLVSCSTPLRYKYTSSKRSMANFSGPPPVVSRIEISLRDPRLFVSGMDSTILHVMLFDEKNNVLSSVDPSELTISTSEDIEAKPFSIKQGGVYKASILPYLKSSSIQLQVDWKGKVYSDVVVLESTMAPLKNFLLPMNHEFSENRLHGEINVQRGRTSPETESEGFSFLNLGENRIVVKPGASRTFSFDYQEQARQNIMLQVEDSAPNIPRMHSIFIFFPRTKLPSVDQQDDSLHVTLPNGELMSFKSESKEIIGGVFSEGPLVVHSNRFRSRYPDLKYHGKGVVLRVNARGESPQYDHLQSTQIDLEYGIQGSREVLILNGTTGQRCRRPKTDFWEPIIVAEPEFKFATDEAFDVYLKSKCGFSLPKL